MDATAHRLDDQRAVRRRALAALGVAHAAAVGLERAATGGPGARARRGGNPHLERKAMARHKKSLRGKAE